MNEILNIAFKYHYNFASYNIFLLQSLFTRNKIDLILIDLKFYIF